MTKNLHPRYIRHHYKSIRQRTQFFWKTGKKFEYVFHKSRYLNDQQAYEKRFSIIIYEGNVN